MREYYYPNRTLCDVLREMRTCYKTRNFSGLMGLIEEAQIMGNRMEASLYDKVDLDRARKELAKIKKEIKDATAKRESEGQTSSTDD